MKKRRIITSVLAVALAIACLPGCNGDKGGNAEVGAQNKYGETYPLKTNGESLSMWTIHSVHNEYKSYKDMPFFQEAEKRTGVKLDVQGPTGGQFMESFNLMIASGDLPDLILYDWGYPDHVAGGPDKYIKEKYILPLNDIINNYAPNLKKILDENPDIDKAVKTDTGNYYVFPNVTIGELNTWSGPVVRQDWLDDLGLAVPETIDDWQNMLTRFKDEKGSSSPLLYIDTNLAETGFISGAFGEKFDYYLKDGKVTYGPANPGWKDFLQLMNKWYAGDLIDKDIATLDATTKQQKIISGRNGAFLGSGGELGTFIPLIADVDPKAKFVGVPYPVLEKGQKPEFGIADTNYRGTMSTAISAECSDVELAAKFMDYFYSDEGRLFANFGIEGVTYNMVNGEPKLTDMVLSAQNINQKVDEYAIAEFSVIDKRLYDQTLIYEEQPKALKVWGETNAQAHVLPVLLPTEEEANEMAKYTTEISTYAKEMYIKYMVGSERLDTFDTYVEHLNELGLQEVLNCYQEIYERYQKR